MNSFGMWWRDPVRPGDRRFASTAHWKGVASRQVLDHGRDAKRAGVSDLQTRPRRDEARQSRGEGRSGKPAPNARSSAVMAGSAVVHPPFCLILCLSLTFSPLWAVGKAVSCPGMWGLGNE